MPTTVSKNTNYIPTHIWKEQLTLQFRYQKNKKNETGISNGAASVSYAAVHYILKTQKQLPEKNILLLGVGEIGQNTIENLVKAYLQAKSKNRKQNCLKKQRRLPKNIIFLISISRTSLRNWNKPIFLSLQLVQVSLSCILRICLKRIFWL